MNENVIFFFSGTGNSFDIAKRLAENMKNTDLYNIATITSNISLESYKRVGLVFPVYGFTMPNIVKRFIECLDFNKNAYYFCVATMGAFALGALYRTAEAFNKANSHLDYAEIVYMPENYILFSRVPSEKLIDKHLKNSVKRVRDISNDVLSLKKKPPKKPLSYGLVQKTSEKETAKWHDTAKGFNVSPSCVMCEKCVRLCPVKNISVIDSEIYFSNQCECCLVCIHACPNQSINYGDKTIGKKRYLNPNINIDDLKKY